MFVCGFTDAFIANAKCSEVLTCFRTNIIVELEHDSPYRQGIDGYVVKTTSSGIAHLKMLKSNERKSIIRNFKVCATFTSSPLRRCNL